MILVVLFASTNTIHGHIITWRELVRGVVDRAMACIRNYMDATPAGNRGLGWFLSSGDKGVCVVAAVLRHRERC